VLAHISRQRAETGIGAAVKAGPLSKKEVAARAGMTPYQLSRLLNGRLKRPSLPAVEAVLGAIGKRMEDLYAGAPSNDVRQALRVLTDYVDTHESPRPALLPSTADVPRVRPKKRRSRTVTTYDAAANPNAILLDSGETTRKKIPTDLWNRGARRGVRVVGDVNTAVYLKYYQERDGQKMLLSAKAGLEPLIIKRGDDVQLHGIVILPTPRVLP
jgi:transcriptional regulator with XRE-family HTH domain